MTCRTGIMIMMMMLVVYCLFVCFAIMGLQYGDCPLMGGGRLVKVLRVVIVKNCVTVGRSGTHTVRNVDDM